MKILNNSRQNLHPQDIIIKYTILPLIPQFVRPNHITILRFILTPLVVYVLWQGNYRLGIPFLILVALTDAVDGSLARVRNQITEWGKVYDPLADKLLINSSLIMIAMRYFFWTTLTIVLIDLTFIFAGWRWKEKGIDIQANFWGKLKMNFQVLGVVMLLLAISTDYFSLFYISLTMLYLAIVFAIASLFSFGI